MFSRAINMFRSFRTSEFYTDEEKEDCSSRISIDETSPINGAVKDDSPFSPGFDEINNSGSFQHGFNTIQPRASIRMIDVDVGNKNWNSTKKISQNINERKIYPDAECHDSTVDDSVMIAAQPEQKNKVDVDKNSSPNSERISSEKVLLCVDNEEPGPLVIDLDDSHSTEEHYSSDSQSSYHTSPQEVFDLCEPEPKVYKVNEKKAAKKKQFDEIKAPCGVTKRTKAAAKKDPTTDISSQSKLQVMRNAHIIDENELSEKSTTKTRTPNSEGNIKEKEKEVEDDTLRLRLPIKGTRKKKLFTLKTSQLIALISNKYHPLHKWQDIITLKNINGLTENEKNKMVKLLGDFLEVKIIQSKS